MESETKQPQQNTNLEKILLIWEAPSRDFKKQDPNFWVTAISILVLVGVIFFFAKEFFVIIPAGAAIFLYYVLSTIPPENVTNKLTNRGVHFGPNFFSWQEITAFYFKPLGSRRAVIFETNTSPLLRQTQLIINPQDENQIKQIALKNVPLVTPPVRFIDKFNKLLSNLLPLEDKKPL